MKYLTLILLLLPLTSHAGVKWDLQKAACLLYSQNVDNAMQHALSPIDTEGRMTASEIRDYLDKTDIDPRSKIVAYKALDWVYNHIEKYLNDMDRYPPTDDYYTLNEWTANRAASHAFQECIDALGDTYIEEEDPKNRRIPDIKIEDNKPYWGA